MYFAGINDLKSINTRRQKIKTRVEKMGRILLSIDELIRNYILIVLIFRESRLIFPSPILCAIGMYSIFSTATPNILAAAASPATQSVVSICDFIETISSFDTP